ncbi:hypothetical protein [Terrimonas pollutisoli]|uniref:hypothetical protein n=1 Tax=Terrimonas pollutisoli TaxID=3034147 RepID=UPI0023ED2B6C|nr:hypothetical protein [Terrimonas sp. H1YJ31]
MNTVGKTIKQLKIFIKDRIRKKIIPYIDLTCFMCLEEDVESVFLNWRELSKIYRLELSENPWLVKYRDIFIVGCLTGFRFSDYSILNLDHLQDGMLHVRQYKTGNPVVVPLREDTKHILIDKYDMRLPKVSMENFKYLAGTPSDLIMAVSGHNTEKAFKKYIKVDHIKKARMIKKLWENQPGL